MRAVAPTAATEEMPVMTSINARVDASVSIRPARDTDLAAIESLLTANHLPTVGVQAALCGFLVAEADQQLVGVVGMEKRGDYGLLRSTAVAPEWRGQQVAKRLVDRIIA